MAVIASDYYAKYLLSAVAQNADRLSRLKSGLFWESHSFFQNVFKCKNAELSHHFHTWFKTIFLCFFRVQELMGGEQRETGRIPRTVECQLTSDLCDSCVPGDTVTVTGIVRVTNDGTNTLKHTHFLTRAGGSLGKAFAFYW